MNNASWLMLMNAMPLRAVYGSALFNAIYLVDASQVYE